MSANSQPIGPIVLLGRIFFGLIFLMASIHHFQSQTIAYAASQGAPLASISVPFSGVLDHLGSLSIIPVYPATRGAWLIVLFLLGITPIMHNLSAVSKPMARQMEMIMFMKNPSMLG